MTRPLAFALRSGLALLLAPLAACGGGEAPATDASAPTADVTTAPADPGECQMVSNADASAALGMAVTFNPSAHSGDICNMNSEPTTYLVGVIRKRDGMDLETYSGNLYPNATPITVEGLGDGAVWIVDGVFGHLLVQKGEDVITTELLWGQHGADPDPSVHQARAEALARAVLPNA